MFSFESLPSVRPRQGEHAEQESFEESVEESAEESGESGGESGGESVELQGNRKTNTAKDLGEFWSVLALLEDTYVPAHVLQQCSCVVVVDNTVARPRRNTNSNFFAHVHE